jgi:hypothetical protein
MHSRALLVGVRKFIDVAIERGIVIIAIWEWCFSNSGIILVLDLSNLSIYSVSEIV